jgi:integrase
MINRHIMPYFKHYRLDEIRPSDVRALQAELLEKMSARSVKNVRNLLSKILEEAVMDELIAKNPVKLVKPPRHEREDDIIPFTLEEVQLLIANASKWMRPFITTAFFTGMRYGELVALKWRDIDFNSKKIIVRRSISHGVENSTKTGKVRIVDMLTPVHDALKEKFKENGLTSEYIFTTRKGTPYSESAAITTTHWKPLLKRCGIAYRVPYNTRHTFATLMLLNGEDILWVSKMLGHADVSTTMRYYIKFIEEKGKKRATFLDKHFSKNRTVSAQSETKPQRHA